MSDLSCAAEFWACRERVCASREGGCLSCVDGCVEGWVYVIVLF